MTPYELVVGVDDIPVIMRGDQFVGRALTPRDGEKLVAVLNEMNGGLRERLLSEVSDAIENCFDGGS